MTRRVGYVLLEFPRYSETFILSELAGLREFGIPSRIFCLRSGTGGECAIPAPFEALTEVISDAQEDLTLRFREVMDVLQVRPEALIEILGASYRSREEQGEPDERSLRSGLWPVACALRIAASCRRHAIDHLHCHYATQPAEVGSLVTRLAGIPCSFTGHAKDIFTKPPEALGALIRRMKFVVGCSRTGVDLMRRAAPDRARDIHCVYHGIRLADWNVARKPPLDPPLIVAIGRLTPKKGFQSLVEAIDFLREHGVAVQAEIIGEGRDREPIDREIRRRGLQDCVRLAGRLPQEKIRLRFEVATALVLPSIVLPSNNQDGVANVVLEAMASGVPVIVSDVPALGEVVSDGVTGLVFPQGDSTALARKIDDLLRTPGLQTSLSVAGRNRVTTLDSKTAADTLVSLFHAYD